MAVSDWSTEELVQHARSSIEEFGDGVDEQAWDRLAAALTYVAGDYRDTGTYERLVDEIGAGRRPLLYLAIPPSLFETVIAGLARWTGVPFHIRSGKCLATNATEVLVQFKQPRHPFFVRSGTELPDPNQLLLRLEPSERVCASVLIKHPGEELRSRSVDLTYDDDEGREGPRLEAYARLLDSAFDGDQRRFARADGVEEAWRIVAPVLDDQSPPIS